MMYPITDVAVTNNLQLNVTRAFLSRSLASLEFDDSFERLIPTATGFVPSPEPWATAKLVINLKDGPLASKWSAQIQHNVSIGHVFAYADVNAARNFQLSNCAIMNIEFGHDGEPTTIITVSGTITREAASAAKNV